MDGVIVTGDRKYETHNNNGRLTVLRNGQPWERNLIGDGYVLSLVQRIEELEEQMLALFEVPKDYTIICHKCGCINRGNTEPTNE